MQSILNALVLLLLLCTCSTNAAPVIHPHLALVETGTGKEDSWHFSLLVYNGNEPLILKEHSDNSGDPRRLYDICIHKGQLQRGTYYRGVFKDQAVVDVPLLPRNFQSIKAFKRGVEKVLNDITALQPDKDGWVNCLGWALEGAKKLHERKFISEESLEEFTNYINQGLQEKVAEMRDQETKTLCNLNPNSPPPSRVVTKDLKNRACSSTSRTRSAPAKKDIQGKMPQMQKAKKQAGNSKGRNVVPPKQKPRTPHPRGK